MARFCGNCGAPLQDVGGFCGQCGTSAAPPQAEVFTAPASQPRDDSGSSAAPSGPVSAAASSTFTPPPIPPSALPALSASEPASNPDAAGPPDGVPASPSLSDLQQVIAPAGKSTGTARKSKSGIIVLVIAAVVLVVVSLAVISNRKSSAGNDSLSESIKEHNAAINDHKPEMAIENRRSDPAYEAAKQYWDRMGTRCGSNFYVHAQFGNLPEWILNTPRTSEEGLTEFKDFQFSVTENSLTEADRLNGFEWSGSTKMTPKAFRSLDSGIWTQWTDGTDLGGLFSDRFFKKNGKWFYNIDIGANALTIDSFRFPPTVNCNEISN